MTRKKSKRLAEVAMFPEVVTVPRGAPNPGLLDRFAMGQPITLEVGCGKGEYTVQMARREPDHRFVGIDLKGDRLNRAAVSARAHGAINLLFVRIEAQRLREIIRPDSVREIWLTYPDPHPGPTDARRRLTAPDLLTLYAELLIADGTLHLKTDDLHLHNYSRQTAEGLGWRIIESTHDLYAIQPLSDPRLAIRTTFEERHLAAGKTITYLRIAPR